MYDIGVEIVKCYIGVEIVMYGNGVETVSFIPSFLQMIELT